MSDSSRDDGVGAAWRFWQEAARLGGHYKWDEVRALFSSTPEEMPSLHFAGSLFSIAAKAGELGIIQEMLRRGYKIEPEEGATLLRTLVLFAAEKSAPVITFLVEGKLVNPERAILELSSRSDTLNTVETMELLRQAQADVLAGGSSFFLALFAHNPNMMRYLRDHGADLYGPGVVSALYGRRAEVKGEALQLYSAFLEEDRRQALDLYQNLHAQGQAPLALAARAGKFREALAAAGPVVRAEAITSSENGAPPVLAVLAAHGELDSVFDLAHWQGRSGEVKKIYDALSVYRAAAAVDLEQLAAAEDSRRLRGLSAARRDKWRLGP